MADDDYNLLEKTELWVQPIRLRDANLTHVAAAVAKVLEVRPEEILVTDVRDETLTLDVLRPSIRPENLIGKRDAILACLAVIDGIRLLPETDVHSEGILGFVALDAEVARGAIELSREMAADISARIAHRAMIFSTGAELLAGLITDTNYPALADALTGGGFEVQRGPVLPDSRAAISRALSEGAAAGYGLLITTGGIGAEDKDHTVEAVQDVDAGAATPYIVHYEAGTGRHTKDGVRLAVGRIGRALIVSLPGPNDEVQLCLPVLLKGLRENWPAPELAESLAAAVRRKWRQSHPRCGHPGRHPAHGSHHT